tara:strand:+ start:737 stop:862 length:126 start_codon:yes stop_codon:yes gene_type:complete
LVEEWGPDVGPQNIKKNEALEKKINIFKSHFKDMQALDPSF